MRGRRRHHHVRIIAGDAVDQLRVVGRVDIPYILGLLANVQTQVGFAMVFVKAVTEVTAIRQDWTNIAIERDFVRRNDT